MKASTKHIIKVAKKIMEEPTLLYNEKQEVTEKWLRQELIPDLCGIYYQNDNQYDRLYNRLCNELIK